jgi:hypothetical protein
MRAKTIMAIMMLSQYQAQQQLRQQTLAPKMLMFLRIKKDTDNY